MRAGVYPINQNVSSCTMRYLLGWSAQTFGRIDTFYILFLIVNVMTVIILPILFVFLANCNHLAYITLPAES